MLILQLFLLQKIKTQNSSRSQKETFSVYQSIPMRKWWFCALRHNLDRPKFLESVIKFDESRYSTSLFSLTTSLFSSIGVWIQNITPVEEGMTGKPFIFIHVQSSRSSGISKKTNVLDFSRRSNPYSSKNTALIFSFKVSIKSLNFVEE